MAGRSPSTDNPSPLRAHEGASLPSYDAHTAFAPPETPSRPGDGDDHRTRAASTAGNLQAGHHGHGVGDPILPRLPEDADTGNGLSVGAGGGGGASGLGGAVTVVEVRLLDTIHGEFSVEEVQGWCLEQRAKAGRDDEPLADFCREVGAMCYARGLWHKASAMLRLLPTLPSHGPEGIHLLGHSLFMSGNFEECITYLKRSVNDARYQDDWQLLVEAQLNSTTHMAT